MVVIFCYENGDCLVTVLVLVCCCVYISWSLVCRSVGLGRMLRIGGCCILISLVWLIFCVCCWCGCYGWWMSWMMMLVLVL